MEIQPGKLIQISEDLGMEFLPWHKPKGWVIDFYHKGKFLAEESMIKSATAILISEHLHGYITLMASRYKTKIDDTRVREVAASVSDYIR